MPGDSIYCVIGKNHGIICAMELQANQLDLNKSVYALALMPDNKPLKLTEVERKVFNVMLKLSMEMGTPETRTDGTAWFKATLTQIGERLNLSRQDMGTDFYKTVCKNLMEVVLEFSSPSNSDVVKEGVTGAPVTWKARHLVDKVDIVTNKTQMTIYWRFDSELEPYLLNPTRFAQLKLESIAKLSSSASIVLYENCARYKDTESGSTGWKDWKWWVSTLTGMPTTGPRRSKTYDEYRYFSARVIRPAIAEINEKTEITIELDIPKKVGKTVSEIRFLVKRKDREFGVTPERASQSEPHPELLVLTVRSEKVQITSQQIEKLLKKYPAQSIVQALDSLDQAFNQREIEGLEMEPIRSNHAYVAGILQRMHGGLASQRKKPVKEIVKKVGVDDSVSVEPTTEESPPASHAEQQRKKFRAELMALPENDRAAYGEKALSKIKVDGRANDGLAQKVKDGLWTGLLLATMVDVYATETAGPNWQSA